VIIIYLQGWENPILQNFRNKSSLPEELKAFSSVKDETSKFNFKLSRHNFDLSLYNSDIIQLHSLNPKNESRFSLKNFVEVCTNPLKSTEYFIEESEKLLIISTKENNYKIIIKKSPFNIEIRSSDEKNLYCQINSVNSFSNDPHPALDFFFDHNLLYGLPERVDKLILEDTKKDKPYRLNNYDRFTSEILSKSTSYGSIPLVFSAEKGKILCLYWANASKNYFDVNKDGLTTNLLCFSKTGDLNCYLIIASSLKEVYKKNNHFFFKHPLPPYFTLG
jgi:alpha-glucosidase (family GH31 glycosyl hydrolase)